MAQGYKRVTVNATGCEFDPHWRKLKISISSLWCRGKARRRVPPLNTPIEFGGKEGYGGVKTRFPLPTLLRAGNSLKLI